jgi:hypothetical protein
VCPQEKADEVVAGLLATCGDQRVSYGESLAKSVSGP